MKYLGEYIGEKPTLGLLRQAIVSKSKYHFSAEEVYDFYEKRNWRKQNGKRFSKLEILLGTYYNYWQYKKNEIKQNDNEVRSNNYKFAYYKQLEDPRWNAFRQFIFAVRGRRCEMCGATENLQIHHPEYRKGLLAWEYSCKEVLVVCRTCHCKIHNIEV